jgi:hypothetical protein
MMAGHQLLAKTLNEDITSFNAFVLIPIKIVVATPTAGQPWNFI